MLKSHRKTILEALGRGPIHPFPARMAPGIALEAVGDSRTMLRVLDPMAGSGTVLAVARANGHRAVGIDVDPLAVLMARVWTRTVDAQRVREKAVEVLNRAKGRFAGLPVGLAYPRYSDEETREFVRYWFDDYARRQLTALSTTIGGLRDDAMREILWCAFSRLIITKQAGASLAIDLSHSRPHRHFKRAPIQPFDKFLSAVDVIASNCPQDGTGPLGPPSLVKRGDARNLDIESDSIDLVLTSPPYLNAIDYMRCSKFSLVWMGHTVSELRCIRGESVGAEARLDEVSDAAQVSALIKELKLKPKLSARHHQLLARYVWDMGKVIGECARVLRRGGRAVYVVGDSTCRGTFIRNSVVVSLAAQQYGLSAISQHSRQLPANRRYMPPPQKVVAAVKMDARMRREVVLAFRKQ